MSVGILDVTLGASLPDFLRVHDPPDECDLGWFDSFVHTFLAGHWRLL